MDWFGTFMVSSLDDIGFVLAIGRGAGLTFGVPDAILATVVVVWGGWRCCWGWSKAGDVGT